MFPTICVKNRPIVSEPLSFFGYNSSVRLFLTIAKDASVWQDDLVIGEKMFSEVLVCPYGGNRNSHVETFQLTQDILKQRMKYPGIQENPAYQSIAKIWVLPTKIHLGPDAESFLQYKDSGIQNTLEPHFTAMKMANPSIQMLKIEVGDGGERPLLYSILDAGFRPSLILVKWSHDLDEHNATAHCAGHLLNTGYRYVSNENGYSLYYFKDEPLYDICSMKDITLDNPMMTAILHSVNERFSRNPISEPKVPSDKAVDDKAVDEAP